MSEIISTSKTSLPQCDFNSIHRGDDRFYQETGLAAKLADLLIPVLSDLGFRLVRVKVSGGGEKTLQIMAERQDGSMSIEDCETLSRHLSAYLDVQDLITGSYRLEVSSPGIDRPLVRLCDFKKWSGHFIKIDLKEPIEGKRRFTGRLEGYQDEEVRLQVDLGKLGAKTLGLPLNLISEVRLLMTEALVRESLSRSKKLGSIGNADGREPPV